MILALKRFNLDVGSAPSLDGQMVLCRYVCYKSDVLEKNSVQAEKVIGGKSRQRVPIHCVVKGEVVMIPFKITRTLYYVSY